MKRTVGIMGAMKQEVKEIVPLLETCNTVQIANRTFYSGTINGVEVVVVISQIGKVAAATTVSILVHLFHVTEILFSGTAGALSPKLKMGDIVVANRLIQHDFDVFPLFPHHLIPHNNKIAWECTDDFLQSKVKACKSLLEKQNMEKLLGKAVVEAFFPEPPSLYVGAISSGDQFIYSDEQRQKVLADFPDVLCVEMEGAAVAQACDDYELPFTIIRYISDNADVNAHVDFEMFVYKVASIYSREIVKSLI